MARELLTTEEFLEEYNLKIDKARFYESVRLNLIGGVVRIGRQIRIDRKKFEEWLDNGGQSLPGGWRKAPVRSDSSGPT